jgi:hypothetical protein
VLDRIWQTKYFSIVLLEDWIRRTNDRQLRAGLETQLIDERRLIRLLSDEIRRLGGRPSTAQRDKPIARPFAVTEGLTSDLHRLCAYYRGIKAVTLYRCGQMMPLVDPAVALVLDRVARDDERHIRWADLRLNRLLTYDELRSANLLTGRIRSAMEAAWEKPWREVTRSQRVLSGR